LGRLGGRIYLAHLHRVIPTVLDPMLSIIAHHESSHQLLPFEHQVSQTSQIGLSDDTNLVRLGAAAASLLGMAALVKRCQHRSINDHFVAHYSYLLTHKRWQFTRELPSKKLT
jgi:hypothetical protein